MSTSKSLIPTERIQNLIIEIRGHRVILDSDLADLYGVTTKRLNEQVTRNQDRFPDDFMLQLTKEEYEILRSHFATLKKGPGQHRKYMPYAFTEHGTIMLANILKSPTAVQASIQVVRAFIQMRQLLASQKGLMRKILDMENKYDDQFKVVFTAIRQLMEPPKAKPKHRIGFKSGKDD